MWLICCPQGTGPSQPGFRRKKVWWDGTAGQGMLLEGNILAEGGCLSSMVASLSASEKETRGKRTIASLMGATI
jgi:hypothetical protein